MKKVLFLLMWLPVSLSVCATESADLDSLLYYMNQGPRYMAATEARITEVESRLHGEHADRYAIFDELFAICRSYHFDRALEYVQHLNDQALIDGDPNKIVHATVCKGFLYMSAGLFKESYDLLSAIKVDDLADSVKIDYYTTYARLLYDLAGYNHTELKQQYIEQGNLATQQALAYLTPQDTAAYWRSMALLDQYQDLSDRSIARYKIALQDSRIDEHDRAICLSTIAALSAVLGDEEARQHYMIQAAIADIRSSTKETVAMRVVAERLYREGDIEHAAQCIKYAHEDAQFFNARHRQVEISQILPIIEQENIELLRKKNLNFNIVIVLLSILIVALLVGILLYLRHNRQLKQARQTIEQMNSSLQVANRVKEEYIAAFLSWQMEFLSDVERYQQHVKHAAQQRNYQDLQQVPKSVDAVKRREQYYRQFDEMFLHIYPHFADEYNSLVRESERITLREGDLLSPDLRIVALARLGITKNEEVAQILDYSINTIYTYKTKIKNRSDLPGDAFWRKVRSSGA